MGNALCGCGDSLLDYDPHEHRTIRKPISNSEALIHVVKSIFGIGILAMPIAFCSAGYIAGTFLTVAIALMIVYSIHILIKGMYEVCRKCRTPYVTYSQAMRVALLDGPRMLKPFAAISVYVVETFLVLLHFGICCVYVVFIAESIKEIVDFHFGDIDVRYHMCTLIVPLIIIFSVRDMKKLAPYTTLANVLIFVAFLIIMSYVAVDLPPLKNRNPFTSISRLPIFFGTVFFAIDAVGVVLVIEESMQNPKDYLGKFGIFQQGMLIVLVMYILLGFFGYWKYGAEVEGSVTLNLPDDDFLAQAAIMMFAFGIYITYSQQGYVVIDVIWKSHMVVKVKEHNRLLSELAVRSLVVVSSVACAVLIPNIALIITLIGAFCLSVLGIILPALMDICVRYPQRYGRFKYRLIVDILFILVGLVVGILGTMASLEELEKVNSGSSELDMMY